MDTITNFIFFRDATSTTKQYIYISIYRWTPTKNSKYCN